MQVARNKFLRLCTGLEIIIFHCVLYTSNFRHSVHREFECVRTFSLSSLIFFPSMESWHTNNVYFLYLFSDLNLFMLTGIEDWFYIISFLNRKYQDAQTMPKSKTIFFASKRLRTSFWWKTIVSAFWTVGRQAIKPKRTISRWKSKKADEQQQSYTVFERSLLKATQSK